MQDKSCLPSLSHNFLLFPRLTLNKMSLRQSNSRDSIETECTKDETHLESIIIHPEPRGSFLLQCQCSRGHDAQQPFVSFSILVALNSSDWHINRFKQPIANQDFDIGIFQVYYNQHLLRAFSTSDISQIGTLQSLFILINFVYFGTLYDQGYLRALNAFGSFMLIFGMFMTSLGTQYWHQILEVLSWQPALGVYLCRYCRYYFLLCEKKKRAAPQVRKTYSRFEYSSCLF